MTATLEASSMDVSHRGVKREINIILAGKKRAGKSTLLRNLIGENDNKENISVQISEEVHCGSVSRNGTTFNIFDMPGSSEQFDYSSQQLKQEFDLLVLCIPVHPGAKFHDGSPAMMRSLQDAYGKKIWKHSIVVFTFSNAAWDHIKDEAGATETYTDYIKDYMNEFQIELATQLMVEDLTTKTIFDLSEVGLTKHHILAIPAGQSLHDQILPEVKLQSEGWIGEIFAEIVSVWKSSESKIRYQGPPKDKSTSQGRTSNKFTLTALHIITMSLLFSGFGVAVGGCRGMFIGMILGTAVIAAIGAAKKFRLKN